MAKQYTFVPEKGIVYVTSDLNIREGAPSGKVPIVKVARPGDALKYVGFVTDGDKVGENSKWYLSEQGDFFWSGNTTEDKPKNSIGTASEKILQSPLKKLLCTQRFGERPAFYAGLGSPKGHNGMDFRTRKDNDPNDWQQDVFAVLSGVVSEAIENPLNGKYVRIAHNNSYETVYLHLSSIAVAKGQSVSGKQKIGVSGNSGGASEAPHLHFGYRPQKYDKNNGNMGYIDPAPYFIEQVVYLS